MNDYHEIQPAATWVAVVLTAAVIGMAVAAVWLWFDPTAPMWTRILFVILAPVMIWLLSVFRRLEIVVADGWLTFGFGPFRPSVAVDDIQEISREAITLGRYGGIGIRFGHGAVCYNTRFGEGLRIKILGRKRDYVLTTDHPDELAAALGRTITEPPS